MVTKTLVIELPSGKWRAQTPVETAGSSGAVARVIGALDTYEIEANVQAAAHENIRVLGNLRITGDLKLVSNKKQFARQNKSAYVIGELVTYLHDLLSVPNQAAFDAFLNSISYRTDDSYLYPEGV